MRGGPGPIIKFGQKLLSEIAFLGVLPPKASHALVHNLSGETMLSVALTIVDRLALVIDWELWGVEDRQRGGRAIQEVSDSVFVVSGFRNLGVIRSTRHGPFARGHVGTVGGGEAP